MQLIYIANLSIHSDSVVFAEVRPGQAQIRKLTERENQVGLIKGDSRFTCRINDSVRVIDCAPSRT